MPVFIPEWEPKNDGVTHINVYSKAHTELGRLLTNFAHTPFNHTKLGHFESVEGLWYWCRTQGVDDGGPVDQKLRSLYGFKAKQYGRQLIDEGFEWVSDIDFIKDDVLEGIRCKLRQNWYITEMLYQSTLPLAHYYYYGEPDNNPKVIYLPEYEWQIAELERIRTLCKEKYL